MMKWSMINLILPIAFLFVIQCHGHSIDTADINEDLDFEDTVVTQNQQEDAFEKYEPNEDDEKNFQKDSLMAFLNAKLWTTDAPKTTLHRPFEYVCAPGSGLSHMYSIHVNSQHDRQWQFKCRKISKNYPTNCRWSSPNGYDQPMQGMCASGYVVTGIRSTRFSPGHRDRNYSVRCCKVNEVARTCCEETGFLNNWDAPIKFEASSNKIITGIYSYHYNNREDRRFKLKYCTIKGKAVYDCSC